MKLHSICYYRARSDTWTDKWSGPDYHAFKLVKALKRESFKGYAEISVGGVSHRFENTEKGQKTALGIVARVLQAKILNAGYEDVLVVPVPASSHIDPKADFTGRRVVSAIAQINPLFVATPALYFNELLQKSAGGGGSRNALAIESHLRTTGIGKTKSVILFDDVCTTGGHLKAAARFLAKQGIEVRDAFVVGRTVWEKPDNMFKPVAEILQTNDLLAF
jgi:Phosphoribosyl transferase domain